MNGNFYKIGMVNACCSKSIVVRTAFTLAELLITLSVVGVVAALTLPMPHCITTTSCVPILPVVNGMSLMVTSDGSCIIGRSSFISLPIATIIPIFIINEELGVRNEE